MAATDQLAGEVLKPATLGLLWTGHTAAGVCLANRHPGVRAVLATDVPGTAAAAAAVGANVLVLAPASATAFQQKQIVSEFCRGGVRPCPEALRPRLG
jgi:ribose 5-phosphate isomerase RpiB